AGALSRGRLRRCTQAIVFFRLEEVQMDIRLLVVSTVVGVGATLHESSEGPLAERGIGPMKVVHGWGREFARVGSILAFCAAAALGNPQNAIADSINLTVRRGNVMTDQANLVSTSNSVVGDSQFLQQTFTVGTAGTLTGIQFAPLRDSAVAGDQVLLEVTGGLVPASVSIDAGGFPPGAGGVSAPLDPTTTGPGYADLSAFHITVTAGQHLTIKLLPGFPPGICDLMTNTCAQGLPSSVICFADLDCAKEVRAGTSGNTYPGGALSANGVLLNQDLAFKVLLQAPNTGDAVTLTWTNGTPGFTAYRSNDPSAVIGAPNEIGSTAGRRWVDVPPAGSLWNYLVLGTSALDQSNLAIPGPHIATVTRSR